MGADHGAVRQEHRNLTDASDHGRLRLWLGSPLKAPARVASVQMDESLLRAFADEGVVVALHLATQFA